MKSTNLDSSASHKVPARDIRLSIVAFVAAVLFLAVGIASESAGAHWCVGILCGFGAMLCVYMCLRLHGLGLHQMIEVYSGRANTEADPRDGATAGSSSKE